MKYFDLNSQEKKIEKDFEKGELVSIDGIEKQKGKYKRYARETLNKKANINIRLSQKILQKLKAKAAEEGIPYQTLASSVLHRYVNKRIGFSSG